MSQWGWAGPLGGGAHDCGVYLIEGAVGDQVGAKGYTLEIRG